MSVTTQWIEIDSAEGKFGAYLAIPHTGKGPGIVLIQEIFGVNEHIRSVAEQYAADGYLVIAPDLFWRSGQRIELSYDEAGWKRAVELMNATDVGKAQKDIERIESPAGPGRRDRLYRLLLWRPAVLPHRREWAGGRGRCLLRRRDPEPTGTRR
jgi:hypothetical protein